MSSSALDRRGCRLSPLEGKRRPTPGTGPANRVEQQQLLLSLVQTLNSSLVLDEVLLSAA